VEGIWSRADARRESRAAILIGMKIRTRLFCGFWPLLVWCMACPAHTPVTSMRPSLVALQVEDLDASIRWYTSHLEFKPRQRRAFPEQGLELAILVLEDFELELVENVKTLRKSQLLAGKEQDITGFAKITFSVPNVAQLYRRLEGKSASFAIRLRDSNTTSGQQFFVVLDNEGNWLQFVGKK
jgi:catechol 2,3-dioxygenase-like lactoylglutathione lyase family enzyme